MNLTCISGQKILDAKKANQSLLENYRLYFTHINSQKVYIIERAKQSSPSCKRSQKVNDTKTILLITTTFHAKNTINKTCTSRIIKLITKAKDTRGSFISFQKFLEQSLKIVKNFVICLSHLLKIWKENIRVIIAIIMVIQIRKNLELETKDHLKILITKINW